MSVAGYSSRDKVLIVFLKNGETYKFCGVEDLEIYAYVINFVYKSMGDGTKKSAVFYKANIVGYSITTI